MKIMSSKPTPVSGKLHEYLLSVSLREPVIMRELREETARLSQAQMQIAPEQGAFMSLLTELLGVRKYLEIGVFTGYSSLAVALAMPEGGRITACDVSEEFTSVARRYWERAGVAGSIDLRLAPALETLDRLLDEGHAGTYDFAFVDADKTNYDGYYESALRLLRTGGLMAFDNVLWSGRIADPDAQDADTLALRALNAKLHADQRITLAMLPLADGLTLARKR
jgi:caffeoyl-CoA O-methyltransferase